MEATIQENENVPDFMSLGTALPNTFEAAKTAHQAILREIRQKRDELTALEREETLLRDHRHFQCYKELREATENCGPDDKDVSISVELLEEAWAILGE